MWYCANCRNQIEDRYSHCWQCGTKRVTGQKSIPQTAPQTTALKFSSYEELAHVPQRSMFLFRRGPIQRVLWMLMILVVFKVASSEFLGKYGTYIVLIVGVLGLVVVLWRSFRRDSTEGVGIKLN
jgi:uncharacterized membrane protein YvbJ